MEQHGKVAAVDFLAGSHHGGTGFAVGMSVRLVGFAEPDEHGLPAFGAHQGHRSVGFGLEIALGQHAVDLPLERRRDAFDGFGEGFFSLKEREDEGSVDVVS